MDFYKLMCLLFPNVICILSFLLDGISIGRDFREDVQPGETVNIPACFNGRNELGEMKDLLPSFSAADEDVTSVTRMIPEQFKFELENGNCNVIEEDEINNFSSLDFLICISDGETKIFYTDVWDQGVQDCDLNLEMKDVKGKKSSNFSHYEIEDQVTDREDDSYEIDEGKSLRNKVKNLLDEQLSSMKEKGKWNMRVFYPKTFDEDLVEIVIPALIGKIFDRKPTSLPNQQDETELIIGLIEQFFPNEEHENVCDQTPPTSFNTGDDACFLNDKFSKVWQIKTGTEKTDEENWEILHFSVRQYGPNAYIVFYEDGDFNVIISMEMTYEEIVSISALFANDS